MAIGGWVKLHRCILDKPIWLNSTPEQRSILITILLMVNREPNKWEWIGEQFTVMPGQMITSAKSLCEKAGQGISRQNIRSSLKRFEKLQFLTIKSTKRGMLISVLNWDSYQSIQPSTQPSTQPKPNQSPTTNKKLRIEEVKEKDTPPEKTSFDIFWELYKKPVGRKLCLTKWNKLSKKTQELIISKIPEYVLSTPDPKFRKNPLTYLNGECWNDEIIKPESKKGELKWSEMQN